MGVARARTRQETRPTRTSCLCYSGLVSYLQWLVSFILSLDFGMVHKATDQILQSLAAILWCVDWVERTEAA